MGKIEAIRYHDIDCGHRVVGHATKCKHLHGHSYRYHFHCTADQLDDLGMVIDFGVIKSTLCVWLENNFDHRMIIWNKDPLLSSLKVIVPDDVVEVPFNPTAENLAKYMVDEIGPKLLKGTGVKLQYCKVEETRKCSASYGI
jgi:6-pyruvoyltetrahydropterin/6-carboxytetrahydropterin synthase